MRFNSNTDGANTWGGGSSPNLCIFQCGNSVELVVNRDFDGSSNPAWQFILFHFSVPDALVLFQASTLAMDFDYNIAVHFAMQSDGTTMVVTPTINGIGMDGSPAFWTIADGGDTASFTLAAGIVGSSDQLTVGTIGTGRSDLAFDSVKVGSQGAGSSDVFLGDFSGGTVIPPFTSRTGSTGVFIDSGHLRTVNGSITGSNTTQAATQVF